MDETAEKISAIIDKFGRDPKYLPHIEEALSNIGYLFLRQVEKHPLPMPAGLDVEAIKDEHKRTFVILDCETEGLEYTTDKIIQLSMIKGTCCREGLVSIDHSFDQIQDPGRPLSEEVKKVTNFTDEDLKGKSINHEDVSAFMENVDIVIAFNSKFDRPFVEKGFPSAGFNKLSWCCALENIDWTKHFVSGNQKLKTIAYELGYTYSAHRADSDILATAFVLNSTPGSSKVTAFQEMIQNSQIGILRILGSCVSIHDKDKAKVRGYKWDDSAQNTGQRVWYKDIPYRVDYCRDEAKFLRSLRDVDVEQNKPQPPSLQGGVKAPLFSHFFASVLQPGSRLLCGHGQDRSASPHRIL